VIKIQYANLPAGLHVLTVVEGRHTIVYLLPGLTSAERRAALGRARSNARVGYGPPLRARRVAVALVIDQIRRTAGNGYSALRVHPAFFVPVGALVASVAVTYLLLASVSGQLHAPGHTGLGARQDRVIAVVPSFARIGPVVGSRRRAGGGLPGGVPGPGPLAALAPGAGAPGHSGAPDPARSQSSRPTPSSLASPRPTVSAQAPGQPPARPSPAPSPVPSPTPFPSPTATGMCGDAELFGVCLK
jgi:hypothetical protein